MPLEATAPWHPARTDEQPRVNSTHFFMYVPPVLTKANVQDFRAALKANQFPANPGACNRTLIFFDDALSAGLGYTAKLIALALLVAVQEKRVLIYLPHPTARWCGRPPHTLGCFYEPITHCQPPTNYSHAPKWSTRGSSFGFETRIAQSADMVRMSSSQVHRATFWYKFHAPAQVFAATHELLFRPRSWVREAARCMMRAASLMDGNFAVVHARYSAEKKKERGGRLPPLSDYLPATEKLLAQANATNVFLQTSTPDAVDLFERWAADRQWSLSYTQNARSTHDLWMSGSGKSSAYVATGERTSVVAQTVNALIASRSHHFLSPASSMWTAFIIALMGRRVGDKIVTTNDPKLQAQFDECNEIFFKDNASASEHKHCKSLPMPKLVAIRRMPMQERSVKSSV